MYDAQKVISLALNEVGYLEKDDAKQLHLASAAPGDGNYTKYARDLDEIAFYNSRKIGYAWCDVFVDWCFVMAYGEKAALQLTFQPGWNLMNMGAGCRYSREYYRKNGRLFEYPQPGDQVFFYTEGSTDICHTGIVYHVDDGYVYTVEGNTSQEQSLDPNGGAVCKKRYSLSDARLAGFGRPGYEME